jgi:site-specific DNA recombinase
MTDKGITKPAKRTRFAIYTRYSSEMQNDLSLEAQEERCRKAIAERDGVVVSVFNDGAKSGWSLERNGFMELRAMAARRKFDAVMFWKFDRLARNHDHVVMIKMLLRHEYGVKLYCVEGFSEDDDDSPYSAMMEQMLAVFSAFYSKNLSSETKRGKRQRVTKGEFNGSVPPIGYDLVRTSQATPERPAGLYINLRLAAIVRRAFCMYATGEYSDAKIAHWMNEQPEIQKLRRGRKPIGKEMVRDMLKNRVYTGRVSYAETHYGGSMGERKRSSRNRKEWFEGKHEGFITDELYAKCQQVRDSMATHHYTPSQVRTYLLSDRTYCARCVATKPHDLVDGNYGKMRAKWSNRDSMSWYTCLSRDRGYHKCAQKLMQTTKVDEQVVAALKDLVIPEGLQERVEVAVRSRVEHADAVKRMAEVQQVVERVNFSWEKGYMTPEEYISKRSRLQKELESLRPVDYDDLTEAGDLLSNFATYWDACDDVDTPEEARKQLVAKIVDRVFVYDDRVVAIALYGDFSVVLDDERIMPDGVLENLNGRIKNSGNITENVSTSFGSDGHRSILRTKLFWLSRPSRQRGYRIISTEFIVMTCTSNPITLFKISWTMR